MPSNATNQARPSPALLACMQARASHAMHSSRRRIRPLSIAAPPSFLGTLDNKVNALLDAARQLRLQRLVKERQGISSDCSSLQQWCMCRETCCSVPGMSTHGHRGRGINGYEMQSLCSSCDAPFGAPPCGCLSEGRSQYSLNRLARAAGFGGVSVSHLQALLLIGIELPQRQDGLHAITPQQHPAGEERQPGVCV